MLKLRSAQSVGGPDGQSAWHSLNETAMIAGVTQGTTPVLTPVMVVGGASTGVAGGNPAPDSLASGSPICCLRGGQVVNLAATLALQATLGVGLAVYRAGAIVGGTIAFGWLATGTISPTIAGVTVVLGGGSGTPAFNQLVPVALPAVAANTALVNPPNGNPPYVPMLPGDVVVAVAVLQTSTLAVPLLALEASII
jgi:hypothetical protein